MALWMQLQNEKFFTLFSKGLAARPTMLNSSTSADGGRCAAHHRLVLSGPRVRGPGQPTLRRCRRRAALDSDDGPLRFGVTALTSRRWSGMVNVPAYQ